MNKLIISTIFATAFSASLAFATPTQPNTKTDSTLTFQVIKTQIEFSKDAVKSAKLIKNTNNYAVMLELTPAASEQIKELTRNNTNQLVSIVWNKHVLSTSMIISELGGNFQISNLTLNEAEGLVKSFTGHA